MTYSCTPSDLRQLLTEILSGSYRERTVNSLVRAAFGIASIRLRQLAGSGRLHVHPLIDNHDSTTIDCIADLFQRNEQGQFVELNEYFCDDRDPQVLDDIEVQRHFRIIVFSKLQEGVFRLYRENDPILAKVIRNLKRAAEHWPNVRSIDRFGTVTLYACPESRLLDHLSQAPLEHLETALCGRLNRTMHATDFLRAFFSYLNRQHEFRRSYPLVEIAIIMKRLMARMQVPLKEISHVDEELIERDIEGMIRASLQELRNRFRTKYVRTGKIERSLFETYFAALESLHMDSMVRGNGSTQSQAEYLQEQIPGLSQEEYRANHRTHFEYLARVSKQFISKRLQDLL